VQHLPNPEPGPAANWPCDRPIKPTPPFIPRHEGIGYVEKLGAGVTTRAARRGTPLPTVVGTAPDPHPLQLVPGAGELADDERAAQVAGTGSHTLVRVDGTPTVGPVTAEFDVFMHGTVFLDIIFTGLPTLPAAGTEVWAKDNTHNLWWGEDSDGGAEGQGWLWPGSVGGSFDPELAYLAAHDTRVGARPALGQ
jgi:hypothetical protein